MTNMLGALRANTLDDIDREAGVARLRYITDVPGQQGVYLTKLQQALAFKADPSVTPGYLAAEAQVRGITPAQLADVILETAALWNDVKGPAIEAARIKAKLAVEAAGSAEAIAEAREAAVLALRDL